MEQPLNVTGLESLIASLDNEAGATDTTPAATPPAVAPPAATPPSTTPPATETVEDPPFEPDNLFGTGKHNAAFAQMRVQNKQMTQTLQRIGESLGIDSKDPEVLVQALQRKVLEHQAEESKIPLAMLEKMEQLTSDAEKRETETRAAEATRGFQRVKDEFKLTNKSLSEFATQLLNAGKNPFTTAMDLVTEYKIMNYDALLTKAKDDAIAAASKLQQHGQQNSSQPSTAAPAATPGSAKPVTSVEALEAFMKDLM